MLCLPPSPSTQIRLPLWSKLIPRANLPKRESEPGGETGIVRTVPPPTLLPFTVRAFQWKRPGCSELCCPNTLKARGYCQGQDHVHHLGGPHHHRSDPAAEILQQNPTVSMVWIAQECGWRKQRVCNPLSNLLLRSSIITLLHLSKNRLMSSHSS